MMRSPFDFECRPVECPNSCGAANLQHQHLAKHLSSQCPLSYVECEFSDSGCDIGKTFETRLLISERKVSSHSINSLVSHVKKENATMLQFFKYYCAPTYLVGTSV